MLSITVGLLDSGLRMTIGCFGGGNWLEDDARLLCIERNWLEDDAILSWTDGTGG